MKSMMLSPLEKTCLQWISRGRTVAEIALLEGKSVGDIESYLQSAMVALDAKSIAQALRRMNLSD